ncbi:hypothetical protein N0V83_004909 [Neocucurbitaria cava]|uniref:Probable double zinc ribbon domain-containing protein n=1 Tax=Neocucurbitaria cava TaxID=798079 RepID=A0A9W9CM13_9PLEO|nr:hypothetical protein N0V83_004909 [Neocucurbitaria cava]
MSNSTKSFGKVAKALTAFLPHGQKKTFNQAFQEKLDKARPAEKAWTREDYMSAGVDVANPCLRTDASDGLWVCCCGHENTLVHYQGAFPFKYLKCGRCDHILCPHCRTSEILTPVQAHILHVELDEQSSARREEVRFCRLCRACGLMHRASMDGCHVRFSEDKCRCGEAFMKEGSYFYIGDVFAWRCDPAGRAVELSLDQKLAASERYLANQKTVPEKVKSSATELYPPPGLPRVQTSYFSLAQEPRPHQLPRGATVTDPSRPVRRGAVRRPRETSPSGGNLVRLENGPWTPDKLGATMVRRPYAYREGHELRAVNC